MSQTHKQKLSDQQIPVGRMVPHSVEAEESVLGGCIIAPDMLPIVAGIITDADFFIVRSAWVWEALIRLVERKDQIDYVTVVEELRAQERLEEIGGAAYITYLINNTPSSLYVETYARIVERAAIRRRMLQAAGDIAQLAHASDQDIYTAADTASTLLDEATDRVGTEHLTDTNRAAMEFFTEFEALADAPAIQTGFADLDTLTGGSQAGDFVIVAGRPGMGKTSFLLTIALHNARQLAAARKREKTAAPIDGKQNSIARYVLIASIEMGRFQLMQRLVSMIAGIPVTTLRTGKLSEKQWALFVTAVTEISELPLLFLDAPALTISALRRACSTAQRRYGPLAMVLIDYLQLMGVQDIVKAADMRLNDVTAKEVLSRLVKETARTYKFPIIAAAQLNRDVEGQKDKRPQMHHLKGSGAFEQDSDQVWFIYRDEVYNSDTEQPCQAEILVRKHRHGATGVVSLYFRGELAQFANLSRQTINLDEYSNTWQAYDQITTDDKPY